MNKIEIYAQKTESLIDNNTEHSFIEYQNNNLKWAKKEDEYIKKNNLNEGNIIIDGNSISLLNVTPEEINFIKSIIENIVSKVQETSEEYENNVRFGQGNASKVSLYMYALKYLEDFISKYDKLNNIDIPNKPKL